MLSGFEGFGSVEEKSSSSTTETVPTLEEKTTTDFEKDQSLWLRIEKQYGRIGGHARGEIRKHLSQQKFTLPQFEFYLRQQPISEQWKNKATGLKDRAQDFLIEVEDFPWPDCLECGDTGVIESVGSPYGGKLPCTDCEKGRLRKPGFPNLADFLAGKPICRDCFNTGHSGIWQNQAWRDDTRSYCMDYDCEHGKRAQAEDYQQIRDTYIQAGDCPECRGTGKVFDLSNSRSFDKIACQACSGTGKYTTALKVLAS